MYLQKFYSVFIKISHQVWFVRPCLHVRIHGQTFVWIRESNQSKDDIGQQICTGVYSPVPFIFRQTGRPNTECALYEVRSPEYRNSRKLESNWDEDVAVDWFRDPRKLSRSLIWFSSTAICSSCFPVAYYPPVYIGANIAQSASFDAQLAGHGARQVYSYHCVQIRRLCACIFLRVCHSDLLRGSCAILKRRAKCTVL